MLLETQNGIFKEYSPVMMASFFLGAEKAVTDDIARACSKISSKWWYGANIAKDLPSFAEGCIDLSPIGIVLISVSVLIIFF